VYVYDPFQIAERAQIIYRGNWKRFRTSLRKRFTSFYLFSVYLQNEAAHKLYVGGREDPGNEVGLASWEGGTPRKIW